MWYMLDIFPSKISKCKNGWMTWKMYWGRIHSWVFDKWGIQCKCIYLCIHVNVWQRNLALHPHGRKRLFPTKDSCLMLLEDPRPCHLAISPCCLYLQYHKLLIRWGMLFMEKHHSSTTILQLKPAYFLNITKYRDRRYLFIN